MTSIVDMADDAVWWAIDRWRVVVPALVGTIVVVVVIVLIAGGGGSDKPKIPAGSVATIGGTPISSAAVDHWQAIYQKGAGQSGQGGLSGSAARKAAFSMLAQEGWIDAEAKQQNVSVTSKQLDTAEQQIFSAYKGATKQQILTQLGVSEADLRATQRTALLTSELQQKVTKRVPTPSASAISQAYSSAPQLWAKPTTRDARLILTTSSAQAQAAAQAIKSGTDFSQVAKKYAANAQLVQNGGAVKAVKPGTTGEPNLEKGFFSAPVGQLVGPVKTSNGYAIFKIQKITPAPAQTLQQATAKIKQDLAATAQADAVTKYVKDVQNRWKAKTTCAASVADKNVCGKSLKA